MRQIVSFDSVDFVLLSMSLFFMYIYIYIYILWAILFLVMDTCCRIPTNQIASRYFEF